MLERQIFIAGQKITIPGMYGGVPMEEYHSGDICDGPSISSSGLRKLFNESAAHYWVRSPLNKNALEQDETEAFILGRAAHHIFLGEDDFSTLFIIRPDEVDGEKWNGNKTVCRKWMANQKLAGRTVLTPKQEEQIRGMAGLLPWQKGMRDWGLANSELVRNGILNGLIEQSFFWKCTATGFWKKSRPDNVPSDSGDFCDLKTITHVDDHTIKSAIAENCLHQQGALVCEGWHALTGESASSFSLVFVEKSPPYCVRIVTLTDQDLARGERQNSAAMKIFAECWEKNEWPGPGRSDAEYMYLPDWAQKQIDFRLEQMETQ